VVQITTLAAQRPLARATFGHMGWIMRGLPSSRAAGALPAASAARFEAVDESATMSSRIALLPGLLAATLMASAALLAPAASAAPVATIVEGEPAVLIRDATRMAVAEGVRFEADDLIETPTQAKLLRIEFDDGLLMSIGPGSRLWLEPKFRASGPARAARIYLMAGSVKLSTKRETNEVLGPIATPVLDLAAVGRDTVIVLSPAKVAVFAESGEVRLVERTPAKGGATQAGGTLKLRSGEFYTRAAGAKSAVAPRPEPDFIAQLPRAFLDTLPARASLYAGRAVTPKPLGIFDYDDARPWIDAEASLRPAFLARWKSLANVPAFRKPLAAELRGHPEWDRTLYPEKYLPKPASGASSGGYAASVPAR